MKSSLTESRSTKTVDTLEPVYMPSGVSLETPDLHPFPRTPWWPLAGLPAPLPRHFLTSRPGLWLLTLLLLLAIGVARWTPTGPAESSSTGFDLPSDEASLTLNDNSAEARAVGAVVAPQPEPDQHKIAIQEAPTPRGEVPLIISVPEQPAPESVQATANAAALVVAPPLQTPGPLVLEPAGAVIMDREECYTLRTPLRGDSPMIRTWKMLGLHTLLASAIAAPATVGSTAAVAQEGNKDEAIVKQFGEVKTKLGDIKTSVDALRTLLEKLQQDTLNNDLRIKKTEGDISSIKTDIAQLRQELEELNRRVSAPRISAYPPSATPSGRVRLVNTFSQPVTIIVNNRAYTVAPGETRLSDSIPAGMFSYEVLGIQSMRDKPLAASEVFTITVHAR